ncbi:MAG TPA: ABC transporter permease [Thermomicrobiales bacterium]|nr:ABC transporter permease [Thermomicrobiales bacterium]
MATTAVEQPVAPGPEEQEASQGGLSLRGALKLLLSSGTGKAGVAVFVVLIALSIYVLVTYPLQYGQQRWSNPAVWADNPKAAPPAWTTWLGNDAFVNTSMTESKPSSVQERGPAIVRTFSFPVTISNDTPPSFLSMTLTGITYHTRPSVISASLVRPDGGVVALAALAVRSPLPGETAPYKRYYDEPNRVLLNEQDNVAQNLQATYQQVYPNLTLPTNLATNTMQGLFGRPAANNSGQIEPLKGKYQLNVNIAVADKTDEIAPIHVVYGGTVFGVMGTDSIGRNIWEGLLYGVPIALLIATLTALFSTLIGASLGILSGYAGGVTDGVIQRLCDILSNVPTLPLLIFLVFILGSHLYLIILVLIAFGWPGLTILVRSMVLQIRSGQLVEAAQALGASRTRIMTRHIFPQVAPFIVAQMIFFAPGAILAEAALSFLGLGDPSIPTWGQMLEQGFQTGALYVGYWWWVVPPGVAIVFTALAFMLLALAMEPVVDPRLRQVS